MSRLDDTYDTYFIICWRNVLIRVFYKWSKIKYVTYVIPLIYLIYETKLKTLKQTLKPYYIANTYYYLLKLNRTSTGFLSSSYLLLLFVCICMDFYGIPFIEI